MPITTDLATYRTAVSDELLRRWHVTWADACGEDERLFVSMEAGETPEEFVAWFATKYDLIDADGWFGAKRSQSTAAD